MGRAAADPVNERRRSWLERTVAPPRELERPGGVLARAGSVATSGSPSAQLGGR